MLVYKGYVLSAQNQYKPSTLDYVHYVYCNLKWSIQWKSYVVLHTIFNYYSFDPCPKWREKFDPIASWLCYNTMLEPCLNLQKNCLKQTPLWRLYFSLNSGKKRYQSLWLRNNFCLKVVACLQNKSDAVLPVDIVYGFQF